MNTTLTQSGLIKVLIAIAISGLFCLGNTAFAATTITSNITTNTTWSTIGSPYLIQGDIKVATGTTLTINAGTVVKFYSQASLRIEGKLVANGSATQKVTFTSIKDDGVGGDSNGDGSLTKPAAEDWRTIVFAPGSIGTINYTNVFFAGYAFGMTDTSSAIFNTGGTLTISNSEIRSNYLFGIGQTAGSIKVASSTIKNNTIGVGIKGGTVDLTGNTLLANTLGVVDDGNNTLKLTNNTIKDGAQAVVFYPNRQRSIVQTGNIVTNNQYNGIVLAGSVKGIFGLTAAKDLPYIVTGAGGGGNGGGQLTFPPDGFEVGTTGTLTLVAGTVVKFGPSASLPIYGRLVTSGSNSAPVVFTSMYDNTVGGRATKASLPNAKVGDWGDLRLEPKSLANLNYTILRYGGAPSPNSDSIIWNRGGTLIGNYIQVLDSEFFGVRHTSGTTTIRNSTLSNNQAYGIANDSTKLIDARTNYWGDPSGPFHETTNRNGYGDQVSNYVTYSSWLTAPHAVVPSTPCCSSVLFLPGIMGTRLYEGTTKRWEPSSETDILALSLSTTSISLRPITVGQVIDQIPITTRNIYKSFLADLNTKKTGGLINNYSAYGYDWRLSLTAILADKKLANTVKSLAATSKTGKVTIVAHSNGGLLAKKLLNQLGPDAARTVDEVVFVGVPQLGTPKSIVSMLHGYDAGVMFRYPDTRGRSFASTSLAIYNLLPHLDYFNTSGVTISDSLIVFTPGTATNRFINVYSSSIRNTPELHRFLRGADGRPPAAYSDLTSPSILSQNLINNSVSEISDVTGRWTAPAGIKIHQIAGVGALTPYQIRYFTSNNALKYEVKRTVDGDETVIEPSALAMSTSTPWWVRRWWVNLEAYNTPAGLDREHSDILEIADLRAFIWNNLIGTSTNFNYTYLAKVKPVITGQDRLSFTLHSPLNLSYKEFDGKIVNENNPYGTNAKFSRYGEVQIIDIYNGTKGEIQLNGKATGSFLLTVEKARGDIVFTTSALEAIPSATTTKAFLVVGGLNIGDISPLTIDYDGNGTDDFSLKFREKGTVKIDEALLLSPLSKKLLEVLKNTNLTPLPDKPLDSTISEPVEETSSSRYLEI